MGPSLVLDHQTLDHVDSYGQEHQDQVDDDMELVDVVDEVVPLYLKLEVGLGQDLIKLSQA